MGEIKFKLPAARGMAHDGEEEKHLEDVDQDEDAEKDVEAGEGEIGQAAEEGVSQKRNPEHAGGQKEAGLELAVFGMEKGQGKSKGHRAHDDKEKQNQRDLFTGMHVRDSG